MIRGIHGAILAIMLGQAIGFLLVARNRADAFAHAGMFVFTLALIGGMGAGLVNGFIVPAMMESIGTTDIRAIIQMLWQTNQTLAVAGVLLTSLAYGLWAAGFWRSGWRWTSVAGLAAALVPAIALLSGMVHMDIAGALFCYAMQAGWAAWLGMALLRDKTA